MNKNCPKCGEELITSKESFELWPITTFDSRGLEFDYLCWTCSIGFSEEQVKKFNPKKE